MHESVYLSITSKDLQNYFGLYRGQRRNTNPNFKIELEKQTSKGRKRESNHSLSLGNMNYLSSANELKKKKEGKKAYVHTRTYMLTAALPVVAKT